MSKNKIIHIEDDLFFAKTFQKELQKYGIQSIDHFATCSHALSEQFLEDPTFIFLDHLLENELGANEISKFKAKFKSSKIILLTSVNDLSLMEFAFSNGVDKYLVKNENLEEHLETLFA